VCQGGEVEEVLSISTAEIEEFCPPLYSGKWHGAFPGFEEAQGSVANFRLLGEMPQGPVPLGEELI